LSTSPTWSSSCLALVLAASLETFLTWQGASQMFSSEVMWGNRLNRWNTMPISARLLEISRSFSS
jgi:hypothetical protein